MSEISLLQCPAELDQHTGNISSNQLVQFPFIHLLQQNVALANSGRTPWADTGVFLSPIRSRYTFPVRQPHPVIWFWKRARPPTTRRPSRKETLRNNSEASRSLTIRLLVHGIEISRNSYNRIRDIDPGHRINAMTPTWRNSRGMTFFKYCVTFFAMHVRRGLKRSRKRNIKFPNVGTKRVSWFLLASMSVIKGLLRLSSAPRPV